MDQIALVVGPNMALAAFNLLARITAAGPPLSVVLTLWLSKISALGEESRPWVSRMTISRYWIQRLPQPIVAPKVVECPLQKCPLAGIVLRCWGQNNIGLEILSFAFCAPDVWNAARSATPSHQNVVGNRALLPVGAVVNRVAQSLQTRRSFLAATLASTVAAACKPQAITTGLEKVSLRLLWYPQAQFAGYYVARDLGYYREAGLEVEIRPAGPDLKATSTVAAGSDDFGIAVSNQIITARSNSVPLTIIAQVFQDSANRYVLKEKNRIASLTELEGKPVGLWLGGDEAEFVAMLATVGMKLGDVKVIPQEYSVAPFLQDQYVLSQVTTYNELLQLRAAGLIDDQLQVLTPESFKAAIPSDLIFTSERLLRERPETVIAFVRASMRGWETAFGQPELTMGNLLQANPELDASQQLKQLAAIKDLMRHGLGATRLGDIDPRLYAVAQNVLLTSGQLKIKVDLDRIYSRIAFS